MRIFKNTVWIKSFLLLNISLYYWKVLNTILTMAITSWYNKVDRSTVEKKSVPQDGNTDQSIRPKSIQDYVGQSQMKKQLKVAIESAKIRQSPLEHILYYGPPGLGKTTISLIIAQEMWSSMKHTSGPAVEKQSDIISILTGIQPGDILFVDEIHRLRPVVEEILYSAMEDFKIDIILWTGPGATSVRMDIPPFTLVWATTKLSKLSNPLRDRFGNIFKLDLYTESELHHIASRTAKLYEISMWHDLLQAIAKRSRGTPRITNRIVKIVRDYVTTGRNVDTMSSIDALFDDLGIDHLGLDHLDRKLLSHLHSSFGWGPVGINTLASVIGEEESTIEDVIEPFLLQTGLIERTPRWRKITPKWISLI